MSHRMGSRMKPWPLLVAVLVALAAVCNASEGYKKRISACPNKKGYTTLANTEFVFAASTASGNSNVKKTHGSVSAAEAACNSDDSCIGFTFGGSTVSFGGVMGFKSNPGKCSYMKKRCGNKAGYTALTNTVWTTAPGVVESVTSSAEAAQALCDADPACGGFNSLGKYVLGTVTGQAPALAPVCTYVKDNCPAKYGYTAFPNTALASVAGEDGIASGQLPSAPDAADFCRLEYRCSGFSSDGSYFIGGIAAAVASPGICSYIKNPCPPMAGFTAYADSNLVKEAYSGRKSAKCFIDVYKACLEDPGCKAFNNMRYTWSNLPAKKNMESEFKDAVGICLYVKIEETPNGGDDDH